MLVVFFNPSVRGLSILGRAAFLFQHLGEDLASRWGNACWPYRPRAFFWFPWGVLLGSSSRLLLVVSCLAVVVVLVVVVVVVGVLLYHCLGICAG